MFAVTDAVFEDPNVDMVVVATNHLAIKACWEDLIELARTYQKPLGVVGSADVPEGGDR